MGFFLDEDTPTGQAPSAPGFFIDEPEPTYEGPTLFSDPIGALTSADWWLTRPSGERISAGQAVGGPLMALNNAVNPFGDETVAAGSAVGDAIFGGPGYDARLAQVRGLEKNFEEASPLASAALDIQGALKMPIGSLVGRAKSIPGKVATLAGEGAGLAGLLGFGSGEGGFGERVNNAVSSAKTGAMLNALIGAPIVTAEKLLGRIAQEAPDVAASFERKSIGARQSDYAKSANDLGIVDDLSGDLTTLTKSSIDDLISRGKLGDSREPGKLLTAARLEEAKVSEDIGKLVRSYDDQGGGAVFPAFQGAREYLASGKVPADKVKLYTKRLNNLEEAIAEEGKGKLGYLQQQKISHGSLWDPNDSALNGFNRAIYTDLQKAIENVVPDIAPLNRELQKYKIVKPILQRGVAADEATEPVSKITQAMRTSGGFGVPILAGAVTMGGTGGVIGGLGAAAYKYGTSPEGRKKVADITKRAGSLAEKVPSVSASLPRLVAPLAESSSRPQASTQNKRTAIQRPQSLSFSNSTTQVIDKAMDIVDEKMAQPVVISAERKKSEDFVAKEEGGQKLKAYYPRVKGSGVTVGTGVDLGNRTEYELKHLGLDEDLIKKLKPYLGKKDGLATKILERAPLRLSKDEANSLDKAVKDDINKRVDTKFEKAAGVELTSLPKEAQTVVRSLSYNFGANLDDALPTIWKAIVSKDWGKVQKLLQTTKWKQPELKDRRLREAALLNNLVRSA